MKLPIFMDYAYSDHLVVSNFKQECNEEYHIKGHSLFSGSINIFQWPVINMTTFIVNWHVLCKHQTMFELQRFNVKLAWWWTFSRKGGSLNILSKQQAESQNVPRLREVYFEFAASVVRGALNALLIRL